MRISVDPDPSSLNALMRAFVSGVKYLLLAYERFQSSILEIKKRRIEYDAIDATCKEIWVYYRNLRFLIREERDSFIENSYDHRLSNGLQIKDYYEKVVWNSDAKRLMTYPNFSSSHFKEGDPTAWARHRDELSFRTHEAHQTFLATCVEQVESFGTLGISGKNSIRAEEQRKFIASKLEDEGILNILRSFELVIKKRNAAIHDEESARKKYQDAFEEAPESVRGKMTNGSLIGKEEARFITQIAVGTLSAYFKSFLSSLLGFAWMPEIEKHHNDIYGFAREEFYPLLKNYYYVFRNRHPIMLINYYSEKKLDEGISSEDEALLRKLLDRDDVSNNEWFKAGVYAILGEYAQVTACLCKVLAAKPKTIEEADLPLESRRESLLYAVPKSPTFSDYCFSPEYERFIAALRALPN